MLFRPLPVHDWMSVVDSIVESGHDLRVSVGNKSIVVTVETVCKVGTYDLHLVIVAIDDKIDVTVNDFKLIIVAIYGDGDLRVVDGEEVVVSHDVGVGGLSVDGVATITVHVVHMITI